MKRPLLAITAALTLVPVFCALGSDLPAVDKSVRPGADFFKYVNSAWLKATAIQPDRSSCSDTTVLTELNQKRTLEIIEQTTHAAEASAEARKVADFYKAFMDEATIEQRGLQPLQPLLAQIANIHDRKDLARVLG